MEWSSYRQPERNWKNDKHKIPIKHHAKGKYRFSAIMFMFVVFGAFCTQVSFSQHQSYSASTISLFQHNWYTSKWSLLQIMHSLVVPLYAIIDNPSLSSYSSLVRWMDTHETSIWSFWETNPRYAYTNKNNNQQQQILSIPTIDLQPFHTGSKEAIYALSEAFQHMDLFEPLLIKNFWDDASLEKVSNRSISLQGLQRLPFSNITIDYFTDATATTLSTNHIDNNDTNNNKDKYNGILKPNEKAPLGDIVYNITTKNGKQKFGSQIPLERYPQYIHELIPKEYVSTLTHHFGHFFSEDAIRHSGPLGLFPGRTTVPLFLAGGKKHKYMHTTHNTMNFSSKASSSTQPRTDLHSEPIGNIAIQLHGQKRWTLISPSFSHLLKPSISRHGRAFFFSNLENHDPSHDNNEMLSHIPHYYDIVTNAGDALWVPPWMWHRVDYIEGSVALAASIFHFREMEFVRNNPLFAFLVLPNLLKELLRMQTE